MTYLRAGETLFEGYLSLVSDVDRLFARVEAMHADLIRCEISCCDCCYAFFELTPVEAVYLNDRFHRLVERPRRREILRRARRAEELYRRIREKLIRSAAGGAPQAPMTDLVARERLACPLLNQAKHCDLYEHRPITCRLYGIPLLVQGASRTCGRSGFEKGGTYPTVNLDRIHERLRRLSRRFMDEGGASLWGEMDPLVSVPTALMMAFHRPGSSHQWMAR